ncbi:MAG: hypothetical protein ACI8W1_001598 [Candidatus Azotimanducaceae bacterium]|jgi:hypothetical protein|tara:strand:- start:4210 stop:4431 length:222 start_codon:yes stop_codon:yes gene_type:complete
MRFLGIRTRDELSKSWGKIVGIEKRGHVIDRFRILLDSGVTVSRTREELFAKPERKLTHLSLAWDRDSVIAVK